MSNAIEIGASGVSEMVVGSQDTAIAVRSGDVPVLATPRLLALLEEATCEALRGCLEPQQTSVGTSIQIVHRRPTPMGARVTARVRVSAIDGSRIVFDVHADHVTAAGEVVESIGRGQITRVVVDRDDFRDSFAG
jgi:predicted thioesterase